MKVVPDTIRQVRAEPYDFPITGSLVPDHAALIIIDMQREFCDPDGYMAIRGGDTAAARAIIPRIQNIREAASRAGFMIIYTREGHRPDLSDLPEAKRLKTRAADAEIGVKGPLGRLLVRGEPGWEIVPELAPRRGEIIIDKPGTGAFHATDLHHLLTLGGITDVVLVGVTTGICVSTTAREAADRGFNVLVLEDCCAEATAEDHENALRILRLERGYIAATATGRSFLNALPVPEEDHDEEGWRPG